MAEQDTEARAPKAQARPKTLLERLAEAVERAQRINHERSGKPEATSNQRRRAA